MPTTQPSLGFEKLTPKSVFSVPTGRFVHVSPPSSVTRSVPYSPATNPCLASGKQTS